MTQAPVSAGFFADTENRRALGYYRLLQSVLSGRDPYPQAEEQDEQEVIVMALPARLHPAAAGLAHR